MAQIAALQASLSTIDGPRTSSGSSLGSSAGTATDSTAVAATTSRATLVAAELEASAIDKAKLAAENQSLRISLQEARLQLRQLTLGEGIASSPRLLRSPRPGSMASPRPAVSSPRPGSPASSVRSLSAQSFSAQLPATGSALDVSGASAASGTTLTAETYERRIQLMQQQLKRQEKAHEEDLLRLAARLDASETAQRDLKERLRDAEIRLRESGSAPTGDAAELRPVLSQQLLDAALARVGSGTSLPAPKSPLELERQLLAKDEQYLMLQDEVLRLRKMNETLIAENARLKSRQSELESEVTGTEKAYAYRLAELEKKVAERDRRLLAHLTSPASPSRKAFS